MNSEKDFSTTFNRKMANYFEEDETKKLAVNAIRYHIGYRSTRLSRRLSHSPQTYPFGECQAFEWHLFDWTISLAQRLQSVYLKQRRYARKEKKFAPEEIMESINLHKRSEKAHLEALWRLYPAEMKQMHKQTE